MTDAVKIILAEARENVNKILELKKKEKKTDEFHKTNNRKSKSRLQKRSK